MKQKMIMTRRYLTTLLLMLLMTNVIAEAQESNTLKLPDIVTTPSSTVTIPVELNNTADVVAVQLTVTMPDNVEVETLSAKLTARAADHVVTMYSMGGHDFMVMVYSPTNASLKGQKGTLLTFSATVGNLNVGTDYPMTLSEVALSDIAGQNVLDQAIDGKISIKRMPNLHVVSLDCSTPIAGNPMTITWKVRNDGGDATNNQWKDYIWLVPNIDAGTSMIGSKLLATVDNVSALSPGEYYENTINITLDERIYGNYDLVVQSNMFGLTNINFTSTGGSAPIPYDPENSTYGFLVGKGNSSYVTVAEENEYNGLSDNFFYKRIDIQVPPLPDIQVPNVVAFVDNTNADTSPSPIIFAGLASSNMFYSGKKVKVTATIANKGGADIERTTVDNVLYISNTPDLTGDKIIRLSSHSMSLELSENATTTDEFAATIPYEWYGDTYFVVDVDVNDKVYELANTENNKGSTTLINTLITPTADFEPYNLVVPSQISSGKSFDVNYSVRNIGPGAPYTNSWIDKIYISSKDTGLDDTAKLIGQLSRNGIYRIVLDGLLDIGDFQYEGDNYTAHYSASVKDLPAGTYYIYVKVDANGAVFEYDGENNNIIKSNAIELTNADLAVELVSISEETLSTGTKVAVAWKVKNVGGADIQNAVITDGFYAASNAAGSNSIELGKATNTFSLLAGAEKLLRANITIPKNNLLNGTRYVLVKTNITNSVTETNNANNISNAIAKEFVYVDDPTGATVSGTNLTISSLQVASSVTPGANVSVSYVVKNTGAVTIDKNVKQELFISKNNRFDATATPLSVTGTFPNLYGLEAGATANANVTVTIPDNLKGGQNYIYAKINRDKALSEKSYGDNEVKSAIFINGNLPNFVVTELSVPSVVNTSEPTEVSWTLSNTSQWDGGNVACTVYLSTDATLNSNDKQIASVVSGNLAKGGSENIKATIELEDDVVGTRYIIVKANTSNIEELSTDDNIATQSFTAKQSPLPDLSISNLSSDETWRGGQKVTITATIKNIGDDKTHKDKWSDVFYLSESQTLNVNNAIKLGSKTHVGKLAKDESYQLSAEVKLSSSLKGYYKLFVVTDGASTLVEKTRNNNQADLIVYIEDESDTPADLVIGNVSINSRIMAGEPITISYDIMNQGVFVAKGTLRDVLYMSKDNTWDENDVMVGVATGEVDLEPGTEMTRSVTGRITNMPEGNYYLIVRTNSTHAIAENDYSNNQAVARAATNVAFYTLDLGSSLTVNTSGLYKMPLHAGLSGNTIGVYLSTPENSTAGLYEAFEVVPSTARYERSAADIEASEQELLIPDVKEGNYYILAQDNAAVSRNLNEFVIDGEQSLEETIMTLTAREVQFGATSLSIREGGTNGWISTEIHGALLDSIMDFRLVQEHKLIPAESISFHDQTSSKATFNLNDAEVGTYDVVSELPNGTQATLPAAFHVVPGTNVALGVKLDAPSDVSPSGYAPVTVAYANGGNTDIVIRELLLTIDGGELSPTIAGFKTNPQTELHIRPYVGQDNRGFVVIPPGKQETVNYYFRMVRNQTNLNLFIVK